MDGREQWDILAWTHLDEDSEWTATENTICQGAATQLVNQPTDEASVSSGKGFTITWDSAGIFKIAPFHQRPWRVRDTFQDQNPGHKRTQRAPRRLS